MKILSVGSAVSPHVRSRVKGFLRSGHQNTLLTDYPFDDIGIPQTIILKNLHSVQLLHKPIIFLKNFINIFFLVRSKEYDIFHIYYASHYFAWIVSIFSRKPIIIVAMGGDILFEQHKYLPWYQKYLVTETLKNSSLIIAKSPYIKERIEILCGKKVFVSTCIFGISESFFHNYDVKEKKNFFLFLSLRPVNSFYNIDKIIDVIYFLNKIDIIFYLNIFSFHPEKKYISYLQEKINILKLRDKIRFISSQSEPEKLIEYYRYADFIIALPDSDGIPQSALEGMALECVPILPNNEVYKGVFNNTNSILVSGNPKTMASQIYEKIYKSEIVKIAANAKSYVKKYGTLDFNISELNKKISNVTIKNCIISTVKILILLTIYFIDQFFFMGLRKKFLNVWHILFDRF